MSGEDGDLAHGPGGEPGEARSVGHEALDGGDRHHLGARLAVHVHEHGEEELHTISLGRRDEVGRAFHRGGVLSLECDRHAIALPLSSVTVVVAARSASSVNDVASRETLDGYCVVSKCCVDR